MPIPQQLPVAIYEQELNVLNSVAKIFSYFALI